MIYTYKCTKCNKTIELSMSVADYAKSKNPKCCDLFMQRVYSVPLTKTDMGNAHQGFH